MPRTLPWQTSTPKTNKSTPSKRTAPLSTTIATAKRARVAALADTDTDHEAPDNPYRSLHRLPSSSPPPQSQLASPEIHFMTRADEVYVMVEDEFYSTAQLFTRHLHHAEYTRLKKKAQSQASQRSVSPTHALGSEASADALTRKRNAEPLVAGAGGHTQRKGSGDVESADDLIVEDRRLAGLMFGTGLDTKARTKLNRLAHASFASGSRASRGFGRSQSSSLGLGLEHQAGKSSRREAASQINIPNENEDSDDLDAPPRVPVPRPSQPAPKVSQTKAETLPFEREESSLYRPQQMSEPESAAQTTSAAAEVRLVNDPMESKKSQLVPTAFSRSKSGAGLGTSIFGPGVTSQSGLPQSRQGQSAQYIQDSGRQLPLVISNDDDPLSNLTQHARNPAPEAWRKARAARKAARAGEAGETKRTSIVLPP